MRGRIVTIAERPDLVPLVAAWLHEAFGRTEGSTPAASEALVAASVARTGPPQTFVLLDGDDPVATASFVGHDLDARPDLGPWLASVYVRPDRRGRGHVAPLVAAVEAACRAAALSPLWLYTNTAEALYAKVGWRTVEHFTLDGKPTALMRRDL